MPDWLKQSDSRAACFGKANQLIRQVEARTDDARRGGASKREDVARRRQGAVDIEVRISH